MRLYLSTNFANGVGNLHRLSTSLFPLALSCSHVCLLSFLGPFSPSLSLHRRQKNKMHVFDWTLNSFFASFISVNFATRWDCIGGSLIMVDVNFCTTESKPRYCGSETEFNNVHFGLCIGHFQICLFYFGRLYTLTHTENAYNEWRICSFSLSCWSIFVCLFYFVWCIVS